MNSEQIFKFMLKHNDRIHGHFLGVYARNQIPASDKFSRYPAYFISNTDTASGNGKHWVVFYFSSPTQLEFFDSFAHISSDYGFKTLSLLYPNLQEIVYVNRRIQNYNSRVCGHYCIYFLVHRIHNYSLDQIICSFSFHDTVWNDIQVFRFIKQLIKNEFD